MGRDEFFISRKSDALRLRAAALRLWSLGLDVQDQEDDLQTSSAFSFFEERNEDVDSDSDMSTAATGSDVSTPQRIR